jgi:hypothetical protein
VKLSRKTSNGRVPATRAASSGWSIEIHIGRGGVVREKATTNDPRRAIEIALARNAIRASQVNGIAAYPLRNSRAA